MAVVDFGPNTTTLPVLRLVGDGSGLGDVDRVARDGQPGRDDVAERDQLGDLAIAGDPQHPVVVPVGDEEPAAEGFDRVLEAGGDEEVRRRRIGDGPRADVRDDGGAVRAVHSVDADDVVPPKSAPTPVTSAYAVPPMKATSTTPLPMKNGSGLRAGSPLAKSVTAPVFGSTRQMLPVSGAVTNNAPPGPTALPWSSSRPVTSGRAVAAACVGAPSRFSEARSLAAGPTGDGGSPHAARAQTSTDENAMRCRIVPSPCLSAGRCAPTRDRLPGLGHRAAGAPRPRARRERRFGRPARL